MTIVLILRRTENRKNYIFINKQRSRMATYNVVHTNKNENVKLKQALPFSYKKW